MDVCTLKKHLVICQLIVITILILPYLCLAADFLNRDGTGLWRDGSNWSSYVPPIIDDWANISGHAVTLDYHAPDVACLNLGYEDDPATLTVLNIIDGASLTTHNNDGGDMIGGMNSGSAELNMTGNSLYRVKGNAIWNHHGSDLTTVNIGQDATMTIEGEVWFGKGKSITNLEGILHIKGGLNYDKTVPGTHHIQIIAGGKLLINATSFSEQDARSALNNSFPIFTIFGDDLTVATVDIDGIVYRQITGGLWLGGCNPVAGSEHVDPAVVLSWGTPEVMTELEYNVYIGLAPDDLKLVSKQQKGTTYKPNPDLTYLAEYWWRVDVDDLGKIYKGHVRDFAVGGKVWSPEPRDRSLDVSRDAILSWTGDSFARAFNVYLGTDKHSVNTADKHSKLFHTTVQKAEYKPSLKHCTEYYWRIDQFNSEGKLIAKGDVWSFSTCFPPIRMTKHAKLSISEIMASEKVGPGWIEIYNPSHNTVDMSGWTITDDLNDLNKCRFPKDLTIQPYDYLLIKASNTITGSVRDGNSFYNINFQLNENGGRLALIKSSFFSVKIICDFEYPAQKQSLSYGHYDNEAFFFSEPTPGKDNTLVGSFEAKTYYVSTSGNDSHPGTISQPFRTIAKASNVTKPGDTCILREGTYRETIEPVTSGKPYAPITYTSYPGETATVTGTEQITGWTLHSGKIYCAPMNWSVGPGQNQVFVDGAEMIEARFPSTDSSDTDNFYKPTTTPVQCLRGEPYVLGGVFDQPDDYWAGAYFWGKIEPYWHAQCAKVVASEPGQLTVTGKNYTWFPEWSDWAYPKLHGHGGGFVFGILNALDIEREWCVQDSYLYLYAPGGGDPSSSMVEAKKRFYVADLGDKSYITLKGLNLFCGSMKIDGNHNIIEDCNASYLSHRLFITRGGGESFDGWTINGNYNTIKACKMAYALNTALQIRGSYNTVQNCIIHDISRSGYYDTAVVLGGGVTGGKTGHHNRIECNTMYKSGRMLILPGGHTDTIRYNDLFHSEYYGLTDDCGVIYGCLADGKGTEIAYNICHDNHSHASATGIYLDDGSRNYLIHHNVVYNCQNGVRLGTHHRATFGTRVFNNTLWVSSTPVATHGAFGLADTLVYNNIGPTSQFAGTDVQNNLAVDSLAFVDVAGFDFRLSEGSSAIDYGRMIDGITGIYTGSAPDTGAFEHGLPTWSVGSDAVVPEPNDSTPPSPDPITWEQAPASTSYTTISMTATTAADASGVAYYFECTSGDGHDSGWQDSPTYEDTGLIPGTTYSYRVKACDKSSAYNETGWSSVQFTTTPIPPLAAPVVSNIPATNVMTTTARLNGEVAAGYPYPNATIYWGDNDGGTNPLNWDDTVNMDAQGSIFFADISGLTLDTSYYYRCYATNSEGNVWAASTESFTTPKFDYDPSWDRTFLGTVDANWSNPSNWDPVGIPGAGTAWAYVRQKTVEIDYTSPTIGVLNLGHNDNLTGPTTLTISNGGSLTTTNGSGGASGWDMIGGMNTGDTYLNMTGNSVYNCQGIVIFNHHSTGTSYIHIGPNAQMNIDQQIYYWNGDSQTTLEGVIIAEGGLMWGKGTHVTTISGSGKFRVKQSAYSIINADSDITAGRFVRDGGGLSVTTVNVEGTDYTQIALP